MSNRRKRKSDRSASNRPIKRRRRSRTPSTHPPPSYYESLSQIDDVSPVLDFHVLSESEPEQDISSSSLSYSRSKSPFNLPVDEHIQLGVRRRAFRYEYNQFDNGQDQLVSGKFESDRTSTLSISPTRPRIAPRKVGIKQGSSWRNLEWSAIFIWALCIFLFTTKNNIFDNIEPFYGLDSLFQTMILILVFISGFVFIGPLLFNIAIIAFGLGICYHIDLLFPGNFVFIPVFAAYFGLYKLFWNKVQICLYLLQKSSNGLLMNPHLLLLNVILQNVGLEIVRRGTPITGIHSVLNWRQTLFVFAQVVWINQFLCCLVEFACARTLENYWDFKSSSILGRIGVTVRALFNGLTYNLGTLAAISFFSMFSIVLKSTSKYLKNKVMDHQDSWALRIFRLVYRGILFVLSIFERLNAYSVLYASIEGTGFVDSTFSAYNLLRNNLGNYFASMLFENFLLYGGVLFTHMITLQYNNISFIQLYMDKDELLSRSLTYFYVFRILGTGMRTRFLVHYGYENEHYT